LYYDRNGNLISGGDFIIKPVGFTIPADASRIHGISTEKAIEEGNALLPVLQEFQALITETEYLVAHNISFDEKIVGAEFLRNSMPDYLGFAVKVNLQIFYLHFSLQVTFLWQNFDQNLLHIFLYA
jgi:DNA polymerase III epsilon subunit-like protein